MNERMSAEQFREARKKLGLTTSAMSDYLAQVTGRTQRSDTIRKWESGASLIPYGVPADLMLIVKARLVELRYLEQDLSAMMDTWNP